MKKIDPKDLDLKVNDVTSLSNNEKEGTTTHNEYCLTYTACDSKEGCSQMVGCIYSMEKQECNVSAKEETKCTCQTLNLCATKGKECASKSGGVVCCEATEEDTCIPLTKTGCNSKIMCIETAVTCVDESVDNCYITDGDSCVDTMCN